MLYKVGMSAEVVLFSMLKDEDTLVFQQAFFKDKVGNRWQFSQVVRRVCKDKVELLMARFDESEDVATDEYVFVGIDFLHTLSYEVGVVSVCFHAHDGCAAS